MLIVLEGIDGAGTTTQAKVLVETLNDTGRRAVFTHQPSTGPVGLLIREMLAGKHETDDATMALLFAADRVHHQRCVVEPALAEGTIVVSDRWYHSSYAYQDVDEQWLRALNQETLIPDLAIFLQVDPAVAAARRAVRDEQDIFDGMKTQRRVAARYLEVIEMLRGEGERIEIINGEVPQVEVAEHIFHRVVCLLERYS